MRVSTPAVEFRLATTEDRGRFGSFLAAARHRAGRSLEDIASTTKVRKSFLEALEQGRVETLPEGIYRRAILRNYAAAVDLDPLVALERFDRTFCVQGPPEERDAASPAPAPRTMHNTQRGARVRAMMDSWRSAHSIEIPAGYLAAAMVAFAVVFMGQFVLHGDDVESSMSQRAADGGLPSAPPASSGSDIEPSIGTGGRRPVERVQTPVSAETTQDLDDEDSENNGKTHPAESQLVVTSNPAGARVTVNGIAWGFTPVTIRYLPPGTKTIRVTKDGYLGRERRVNVPADGDTAAVQLTLRPR